MIICMNVMILMHLLMILKIYQLKTYAYELIDKINHDNLLNNLPNVCNNNKKLFVLIQIYIVMVMYAYLF